MSADLVGPLPTISFRGGGIRWDDPNPPKVAYEPPRDTCDPRYVLCVDHHVACDCREAEMSEDRFEFSAWRKEVEQAFADILAGHPTVQYDDTGNRETGCMCTGCQIARAAHMHWYRWQR